ncbi:MAG: hypothetical protein ACJATF_004488, partial [Flavobacteriales bacterium]
YQRVDYLVKIHNYNIRRTNWRKKAYTRFTLFKLI